MANIILHQFNDVAVGLREEDCYINATAMAAAHKLKTGQRRDVHNWLSNKRTQETLEHLSAITGIPVIELYQVFQGSPELGGGTWIHPKLAVRFGSWLSDEFGLAVEEWIQDWEKQVAKRIEKALEKALQERPSLKEIDQAAKGYAKWHGKAYAASYYHQLLQKWYPALVGHAPKPEEQPKLQEEALLTPTQVGEELGVRYKSGLGNARWVNQKLLELGYQEQIGKEWSATQKAINLNLCSRRPVETNSRTQKDQLFWSAKVIDILKEHVPQEVK